MSTPAPFRHAAEELLPLFDARGAVETTWRRAWSYIAQTPCPAKERDGFVSLTICMGALLNGQPVHPDTDKRAIRWLREVIFDDGGGGYMTPEQGAQAALQVFGTTDPNEVFASAETVPDQYMTYPEGWFLRPKGR